MPPTYPPSSSYQPLRSTADEDSVPNTGVDGRDVEAAVGSNNVQERAFLVSPYQSEANNATSILKSFLSETRTRSGDEGVARSKQLSLRVHVRSSATSRTKSVELPLPELTDHDSLPFALPSDVPCLRGLPPQGPVEWRRLPHSFLAALKPPTPQRSVQDQLHLRLYDRPTHLLEGTRTQVWNQVQKKPLYASSEEVERYGDRLRKGTSPPWAPLTAIDVGKQQTESTVASKPKKTKRRKADAESEESEEDSEYDPYDVNPLGQNGDFDLSSVFKKTRKRTSSRLVSVGLQEAIERFSDDRHFSKWLICREVVWGWDWQRLASQIEEMCTTLGSSKGKTRERSVDAPLVDLEVVGLRPGPVYHVVWSPIPRMSQFRILSSRAGLIAVTTSVALFLISALIGVLTSPLTMFLGVVLLTVWTCSTYLVRTHTSCVYDNIGTAWNLAPTWVLLDVSPEMDRERVLASLKPADQKDAFVIDDEHSGEEHNYKLKKTEQGWVHLRGVTAEDWLESHRARILAALR